MWKFLEPFFQKDTTIDFNNPALWNQLKSAPTRKKVEFLEAYAGWMYIASDRIAKAFSKIDLELKMRSSKGDIIEDLTHSGSPEIGVLRNPNNSMTYRQLLKTIAIFLKVAGTAPIFIIKDRSGYPIGLLPLMPHRVRAIKQQDPLEPIMGYTFRDDNGKDIPLDLDEVIYLRDIDPVDPIASGYASAYAVAKDIEISEFSKDFNKDFFYNGAILSGVLSTDKNLTPEQYNKLRNDWDTKHLGKGNQNKTAILYGGLKFSQMASSHNDMGFPELDKGTRDAILAGFGVPKHIVGIVEDVNRANAEASEYVFAKYTVDPMQQDFVDAINKYLLPQFKNQRNLVFMYREQIPADEAARVDRLTRYVGGGIMTPNEARGELDLPDLQNGDQTYLPMGFMPNDTVKAKSATRATIKVSGTKEKSDDEKKKKLTKQQKNENDSSPTLTIKL